MTAFRLLAPIPPMTLDAGCSITFEAIDPATGAAVTGVSISFATIYATNNTALEPSAETTDLLAFVPDG